MTANDVLGLFIIFCIFVPIGAVVWTVCVRLIYDTIKGRTPF